MGLLFRLIMFLAEVFTAVYVVVATVSLLVEFVRFLLALPGALRQDLRRWQARHAEPPRVLRYAVNAAEFRAPALPPPPEDLSVRG